MYSDRIMGEGGSEGVHLVHLTIGELLPDGIAAVAGQRHLLLLKHIRHDERLARR